MHVNVVTVVLNAMCPPVQFHNSLQYIQHLYDLGCGIQALSPDNPKSFLYIGGLHGLPYCGPGETNPDWWDVIAGIALFCSLPGITFICFTLRMHSKVSRCHSPILGSVT